MANLRVPYEVTNNTTGGLIAEAVANVLKAHESMRRVQAILVAIGSDADVETELGMAHELSYGAALNAIVNNAISWLNTIAADMGRLDQGV